MNKTVKILFIFMVLVGIVSIYITFHDTVLIKNYIVIDTSDKIE